MLNTFLGFFMGIVAKGLFDSWVRQREHRTTRLFDKRWEVLERVYELAVDLRDCLDAIIDSQPGDKEILRRVEQAKCKANEFQDYWRRMRIYLEDREAELLEALWGTVKQAIWGVEDYRVYRSHSGNETSMSYPRQVVEDVLHDKRNAVRAIKEQIPATLEEIEKQFKTALRIRLGDARQRRRWSRTSEPLVSSDTVGVSETAKT